VELELGDRIAVTKDGVRREGVLMPSVSGHVVIIMDSGYNAGFDPARSAVGLGRKGKAASVPVPPPLTRQQAAPAGTSTALWGT